MKRACVRGEDFANFRANCLAEGEGEQLRLRKSVMRSQGDMFSWQLKNAAACVNQLAKLLLGGIPYADFETTLKRRYPRGMLTPLTDQERIKIAAEAHSVSMKLDALAAPARRGAKPDREKLARDVNIALCFRLMSTYTKRKTWMRVATEWEVSRSDIFAARKKFDASPSWRSWAVGYIRQFRATHRDLRGKKCCEEICNSLRQSG